jgi:hypothetical protein
MTLTSSQLLHLVVPSFSQSGAGKIYIPKRGRGPGAEKFSAGLLYARDNEGELHRVSQSSNAAVSIHITG